MNKNKRQKKIETLTLAFCIALFPPIWAVVAPYVGLQTGAVALICAGLYAARGNSPGEALKITIGFLLGDVWAWLAVNIMALMAFHESLELFITLFVMGGLAVVISSVLDRFIYCPSWLCGWAIGLVIMTMIPLQETGSYFIQVACSMIVGIWYIGYFLNTVQQKLINFISAQKNSEDE